MTRDERGSGQSWKARPWGARLVRLLAVVAPLSAGAAAAIVVNGWLPRPSALPGLVTRVLVVVAVSTVVVMAVDRVARRLLPLAALYRLSLVFPDRAPSRFRSALKAGSSRRVERMLAHTRAHGLPTDPGDAARRVVELINAIGDHDRRTRGHSERVRLYADLIGEEMRLSKEDRQKLQWAALLHDLGKLMVPTEILNKNGKPTPQEWEVLRRHPADGERLVEPLRVFLGTWADAVGGHHEWWNGEGYPRRLRGEEISRSAAIVAVADAYEVMTAVRSYKKSMPASAARAELTRAAGVQFSPVVVRAFLCVSLGKLRLASGPVASLAQIPFLGTAARFPATVGAAVQSASTAAAAATPGIAASMIVASTVIATASTATSAARGRRPATAVALVELPSHTTTSVPTIPANTSRGYNASAAVISVQRASVATVPDHGASAAVISVQRASVATVPDHGASAAVTPNQGASTAASSGLGAGPTNPDTSVPSTTPTTAASQTQPSMPPTAHLTPTSHPDP